MSSTIPISSPREKLCAVGAAQLTTEELIALVLGSGTAQQPITKLAQRVTQQLRDPQNSLQKLREIPGIGLAKACQLLAMMEYVERVRPQGFPLVDQLDKVLALVSELRSAQREHIVCLYLNTRMQLLIKETVAIGSVNQSVITAKDIFSVIKYHPVSYIILIHNHPSGDPQPSPEDLRFTQKMVDAGHLLGVEILDHVIIGERSHYSFKEHKHMTS